MMKNQHSRRRLFLILLGIVIVGVLAAEKAKERLAGIMDPLFPWPIAIALVVLLVVVVVIIWQQFSNGNGNPRGRM